MIFSCSRCGKRYWSKRKFVDGVCEECRKDMDEYLDEVTEFPSDYSKYESSNKISSKVINKVNYNNVTTDSINNNLLAWHMINNQYSANDHSTSNSSHHFSGDCCHHSSGSSYDSCDSSRSSYDSSSSYDSGCDSSCGCGCD